MTYEQDSSQEHFKQQTRSDKVKILLGGVMLVGAEFVPNIEDHPTDELAQGAIGATGLYLVAKGGYELIKTKRSQRHSQ
jgi:hypothetical protein